MDHRARVVETTLRRFDEVGDLRLIDPDELQELLGLLAEANSACDTLLADHARREPSQSWLLISVLSGVGGIALMGPVTLPALAITVGSVLSAGKSVYDFNTHRIEEQRYISLAWSISMRKNQLKLELARRGIT